MIGENDRNALDLARASLKPDDRADPLADALASVRLTGALFFLIDATTPWCVDIPEARAYAKIIMPNAQRVLSYHVVLEGEGIARAPGVTPVRFGPGDVIIFPHGDAYVMECAPGAPPELGPDETIEFFRALAAGALPFVVTEGGGEPPPAKFICGFLGCDVRPFNPVLESLPRLLKVSPPAGGGLLERLIELTIAETRADAAGAGGAGARDVRLRLSELMFVEVLRRHAAAPEIKPPGWFSAVADPHVARALAALHRSPERAWTVEGLAREAGLSRSAFARRFTERLDRPPLRYLALCRMQVAARLLQESALPVAEIGRRVGYASEAAFSRGFKRIVGVSPASWRRGGR